MIWEGFLLVPFWGRGERGEKGERGREADIRGEESNASL